MAVFKNPRARGTETGGKGGERDVPACVRAGLFAVARWRRLWAQAGRQQRAVQGVVRQWPRYTVRNSAACHPSVCCRACAGGTGRGGAARTSLHTPAHRKKRRPLARFGQNFWQFPKTLETQGVYPLVLGKQPTEKKSKAKGRIAGPFALGKQPTEKKSKLPLFLPPRSHSAHTVATSRVAVAKLRNNNQV